MNTATTPSRSMAIKSSHSMKVQHQVQLITSHGQKNHDLTSPIGSRGSLGIVLEVSHHRMWGKFSDVESAQHLPKARKEKKQANEREREK
ncbi:hypothetical protein CR513_35659, partial [Mucuna pruriens]